MQTQRRAARELALNLLYQIDLADLHLDEVVETARESVSVEPEVFDFADKLARGVRKERRKIDQIIKRLSKDWAISRQPIVDRNILRMAIFELSMEDESTPIPVVVNEAVEMAKKFSTEDSGKFVNGVLGAYLRDKGIAESLEEAKEDQDDIQPH